MLKQILLFSVIAASNLSGWSNNEITYSYTESNDLNLWGASKPQTYDIAIAINESSLIGCEITRISVPVPNSPNISGYSVWLSKELVLETVEGVKVNAPDVMSAEVEPQFENENDTFGYLIYELTEPYKITEEGIYVGYSLTVDKTETDYDKNPIVVSPNIAADGFWVHASQSYRKWKDYSEAQKCVSALMVNIAGDFNENSAAIKPLRRLHGQKDAPTAATVAIANHGASEIYSVEYKLSVNGAETTERVEFAEPIPCFYNRKGNVDITIPALDAGVYDYVVEITKVNDFENEDNEASASNIIDVLDKFPVKRPVMEEYTGTWCGWCIHGFVALEKMAEFHDDFIAISYHNNDPMQISYPNVVDGFPDAWMDRNIECDPYYGLTNKDFGIEELWMSMKEEFTPVEIELEANWGDAEYSNIIVDSNVRWVGGPESEGEYRVEYVLVADSLCDEKWRQSNYYTNFTQDKAPLYLEEFCQGGEYGQTKVAGLVYNDVAVQTSGLKGVEGSILSIESGSENPYSYTFDITDNTIIQNKDNLRVVAMVIYANNEYGDGYGLILNSNVCNVPKTNSINSIQTDRHVISTKYYDLSGREITNPSSGLFIIVSTFSDSTTRFTKIIK